MTSTASCPALTVWGVGVVLEREGRHLLGLRRSALGHGTWGFPGGRIEPGEDPIDCARRELAEETGLRLTAARAAGWSCHADAERQYITLYVIGSADGEAAVLEPDKCAEWRWASRDEVPGGLFAPTAAFFTG